MASKGEKRCARRVKEWVVEQKDIGGNPVNLHDRPCLRFDSVLLLGMVASIVGVVCQIQIIVTFLITKIKLLTWIACYFSLMCVGNFRGKEDFRQILSSFMVSILAIVMLYNKDPSPLAS